MKIVIKKIDDLKAAEYNPRLLTSKQYKDLHTSLTLFGFVDPVIINTYEGRENIIIGGHQRVKVWKEMWNKTVPCIELKLIPVLEKELNIRLNKNVGDFDYQLLEKEFSKLDLIEWGFKSTDFPKLPDLTNVKAHTRDVKKEFIVQVVCNTDWEAEDLRNEMMSRGFESKVK